MLGLDVISLMGTSGASDQWWDEQIQVNFLYMCTVCLDYYKCMS